MIISINGQQLAMFQDAASSSAEAKSNKEKREFPPLQVSEELTSMVVYLQKLLAETLSNSNSKKLTEEDKASILAQVFRKFDLDEKDAVINTSA